MTRTKPWIVVAVDGQAASGKGTISNQLATRLNLKFLDTGKLYRTLTYYLIKKKKTKLLKRDKLGFMRYLAEQRPADTDLNSEFISRHTPSVASQSWARELLLDVQRKFANTADRQYRGAILDGRDIGTVVLPDADVKFFIKASLGKRAQRRFDQLASENPELTLKKVRADLEARDVQDSTRMLAPLKQSEDAILIDTSNLSIEAAVALAINEIDRICR